MVIIIIMFAISVTILEIFIVEMWMPSTLRPWEWAKVVHKYVNWKATWTFLCVDNSNICPSANVCEIITYELPSTYSIRIFDFENEGQERWWFWWKLAHELLTPSTYVCLCAKIRASRFSRYFPLTFCDVRTYVRTDANDVHTASSHNTVQLR